jgi:response regulator of citrate/malate metabolism
MVSAAARSTTSSRHWPLGAAGFVIKPYKPQRIVDLLERYRERSGHDLLSRRRAAAG